MANIGDKRSLPNCTLCGGAQYEEYTSIPATRIDARYEEWLGVLHLQAPGPKYVTDLMPCLRVIINRIKELESKQEINHAT